jgi:hypothetical protein
VPHKVKVCTKVSTGCHRSWPSAKSGLGVVVSFVATLLWTCVLSLLPSQTVSECVCVWVV